MNIKNTKPNNFLDTDIILFGFRDNYLTKVAKNLAENYSIYSFLR